MLQYMQHAGKARHKRESPARSMLTSGRGSWDYSLAKPLAAAARMEMRYIATPTREV